MANAHDLLMAQRAAMMGGKLPYEYAVEYAESNGHQWIDLGIKRPAIIEIDIVSLVSTSSSKGIVGDCDYFGYLAGFLSNNRIGVSTTYYTSIQSTTGANCSVEFDNSMSASLSANGETVSHTASKSRANKTIHLLDLPTSVYEHPRGTYAATARVFSFSVTKGGVKIVDAIPVVAKFEGVEECCFYNRLFSADGFHGNEFYRNGTATGLIAGPRI